MDTDDISWLPALLERRRPDPGPIVGRWALGIGDMVADHSLTPNKLRGLAHKLNHFGGVAISDESVEFDGDDVKWPDETESTPAASSGICSPAVSTSRPTSCHCRGFPVAAC